MMSRATMMLLPMAMLASAPLVAGQYVFPAQGQSAEQQEKDEYSCYQWATGQTGYDPVKAASSTKTVTRTVSTGPAQGSGAHGAVRGAAKGALAAAVVDGSAGRGAALGGLVGGARGRAASTGTETITEEVSAVDPARQKEFDRARAACLEGKGYTIK
jgi:hypothetical protein